jgi:hypothetical protein
MGPVNRFGLCAQFAPGYRILAVLDHFTEKSFHRTSFDRMPFERKFILPKGHMNQKLAVK